MRCFTLGEKEKKSNFKKLHKKAQEHLFFQIYSASDYILKNYGEEALKDYFKCNQESFFDLKMSALYKVMEGVIKKLPKKLKIKEGLKMFLKELEFVEDLKNVEVLEKSGEKGVFEITKCSIRKEFNKLAKKAKKPELIDKCCVWCFEGIPITKNYGIDFAIELTEKGCLNYLS